MNASPNPSASRNEGPPLVTIGMPVYNGEQWIADALRALLAQTFSPFVLVLSDNASTDGTGDICERFARQDPRVQYHRNEHNVGLFKNYDRVFELSSSKYFKWAACGDICRPEFLERCLSVLESRPDVVLAYPKSALFDRHVEIAEPYDDNLDLQDRRPSDRLRKLLGNIRLNNVINGVVRADALRKTALNRPYVSSDINILAELSLQGKFVEIPERLFFRRMSKATATAMKTQAENQQYFNAPSADVYELYRWKLEFGFLKGAWRARIPPREKLAVYRLLLIRLRHARVQLVTELLSWIRKKLGRRSA